MMAHPAQQPPTPPGYQPTDPMISKIDLLATTCELWKKRRAKSQVTSSIQATIVVLAEEIADLSSQHPMPPRKP